MHKQEAGTWKWFYFMKNNYGAGKINIFMNGEAAFTTELALKKVDDAEILAKLDSAN